MGVLVAIFSAVAAPLVPGAVLAAHVGYRVAVGKKTDLDMPTWGNVKETEKAAIIQEQKDIVEGLKLFFNYEGLEEFVDKRLTADAVFEDMLARIDGRSEFYRVFGILLPHVIKKAEFETIQIHHGQDRIVIDWIPTFDMAYFKLTLPMYVTLFLEKSPEGLQIRRIQEEWYGKAQINENTTIPILGRIHQKWRRFNGFLCNKLVESGIVSS